MTLLPFFKPKGNFMKFLFLDIETGDFNTPDTERPFITEIGTVLFDTNHMAPVSMNNILVCDGREVTLEAEQYTGISTQLLNEHGKSYDLAHEEFTSILEAGNFDAIVAHNGVEFDFPKLSKWADYKLSKYALIDTMFDVEFPANMKQKNLTYMQAFHGFVYPGHRAIFDCMALSKIFMQYGYQKALERSKFPIVRVAAKVTFAQKELPKGLGFRWDGDSKLWIKTMRECDLNALTEAGLQFNYARLT